MRTPLPSRPVTAELMPDAISTRERRTERPYGREDQ